MAKTSGIGFVDMELSLRQAFDSWQPLHTKNGACRRSVARPEYDWLKKHKIAFQVLHRYLNPACGGEWAMYYLYIGINEHIFMQNTRIYHKDLLRQIITV